ncbi:MAG: hypothetical protein IPJ77_10910 [Planctomycetes bacterium]|nr:hypothetical protein [Planctomycetota bacterium]
MARRSSWSAFAIVALLAGAGSVVVAQQPSSSTAPRVLPPTYPWETEPLDAIYGHLAEGAFQEPIGVFFEPKARELYVADSRNGLIGIFDEGRIPVFTFGGPSKLVEPRAVVATAEGNLYVLDAQQSELHAFNYRGEPQTPLRFVRPPRDVKPPKTTGAFPLKPVAQDPKAPPRTGRVTTPAKPEEPKPVGAYLRIGAFSRDAGGRWYVGDLDEGRVIVYDKELRFLRELEASKRAVSFHTPVDIAVSSTGLVAVADMQGTPALHVYDADGRLLSAFGERDIGLMNFTAPAAVAWDEQGFLYALDLLRHDVKVFTAKGEFVHHFGGWSTPETRGRAPGELLYPADIAIDPKGPIYIAERFGQRVQAFVRKPKPEPEKRAGAPAAAAPNAPKK